MKKKTSSVLGLLIGRARFTIGLWVYALSNGPISAPFNDRQRSPPRIIAAHGNLDFVEIISDTRKVTIYTL